MDAQMADCVKKSLVDKGVKFVENAALVRIQCEGESKKVCWASNSSEVADTFDTVVTTRRMLWNTPHNCGKYDWHDIDETGSLCSSKAWLLRLSDG